MGLQLEWRRAAAPRWRRIGCPHGQADWVSTAVKKPSHKPIGGRAHARRRASVGAPRQPVIPRGGPLGGWTAGRGNGRGPFEMGDAGPAGAQRLPPRRRAFCPLPRATSGGAALVVRDLQHRPRAHRHPLLFSRRRLVFRCAVTEKLSRLSPIRGLRRAFVKRILMDTCWSRDNKNVFSRPIRDDIHEPYQPIRRLLHLSRGCVPEDVLYIFN